MIAKIGIVITRIAIVITPIAVVITARRATTPARLTREATLDGHAPKAALQWRYVRTITTRLSPVRRSIAVARSCGSVAAKK